MPIPVLLKQIKLLRRFAVLSFKHLLEYKFAFYSSVFRQLLIIMVWLLFWQIIIGNVSSLQNWNFESLAVFVGFVLVMDSTWSLFFPVMRLGENIRTGKIDIFLTRPVQPILSMIMQRMYFGDLIGVLIGLGIIGFAAASNFSPFVLKMLFGLLMLLVAVMISITIYAFVGVLTFWLGEAGFLRDALMSLDVADNYPLNIFPGVIRGFFTFVVPTIFVATYPALIVSEWSWIFSFRAFALELLVLIIWISIFTVTYRKGLRRYESFGG